MNGKRLRLEPGVFERGIFTAMSREEWQRIPGMDDPMVLDRKTVLHRQGGPASHIYLLCSGLVKTFRNPAADRVQIINILSGGDVLGAEALSRDTYTESAAALARAIVFRFTREAFLELITEKPTVSVTLIRMMNHEFERIRSLIVDLGTKKAMPRVASCILLFMEKQVGQSRQEPFNLPISRQEMGAFLGLSPETVSRQLKGLVTSRVIRLDHRRLTVMNVDQLKTIAAAV